MKGLWQMEWFCKLEFYMMMFYIAKVLLAFILVISTILVLFAILNLMYESIHKGLKLMDKTTLIFLFIIFVAVIGA